jgi:hypothetical protein
VKTSISSNVTDAISYWLDVLMDCAPENGGGDCPSSGIGGSLHESYLGVVGTGDECGYVGNPDSSDSALSGGSIAGIVISAVAFVLIGAW